ncbi:MarR family transcriptional regulator [Halalkalicoccus salilacus]|uniref:MarR family transcriptional regulator n=1 Tax=Halalkalicoccus TaxID=332246 RepID=UPI002F961C58
MPIDLRKHNPEDGISIRPDTNKAKIIKLLYRNTNLGYTPAEIRKYLDLPRGSSSTTLTRLCEEGLIGKTSDGLYHGFDHRADLRRFAQSLISLDTLFHRYPEVGISPEDIEQTGTTAKEELSPERLNTADDPSEEPPAGEWIVDENDSE